MPLLRRLMNPVEYSVLMTIGATTAPMLYNNYIRDLPPETLRLYEERGWYIPLITMLEGLGMTTALLLTKRKKFIPWILGGGTAGIAGTNYLLFKHLEKELSKTLSKRKEDINAWG